jgi:hypothetical protein
VPFIFILIGLAQPAFAIRQPIPRICIQALTALSHPVRTIKSGFPDLVHLASKEIQERMDSLDKNEAEFLNLGAGRSILILPDAVFAIGPHSDREKRLLNEGLEFRKIDFDRRLRSQLPCFRPAK